MECIKLSAGLPEQQEPLDALNTWIWHTCSEFSSKLCTNRLMCHIWDILFLLYTHLKSKKENVVKLFKYLNKYVRPAVKTTSDKLWEMMVARVTFLLQLNHVENDAFPENRHCQTLKSCFVVDGSVAFSRPEEWPVFNMLVTLTCFGIKCVIEKSKLNPEKSMQVQILKKCSNCV